MRALGKQRHRVQQLRDLAVGIAVTEHRQAERRLGDEDIAWHQLERRAGGIGHVLVVAGRHDPQPVGLDGNLRRAEHVPGRMKRGADAVERDALAVADGLRAAGEVLAVAQPHDVERLLRGEHRAVTGARVVRVAMRDQRPLDRAGRVDVEAAGFAADA